MKKLILSIILLVSFTSCLDSDLLNGLSSQELNTPTIQQNSVVDSNGVVFTNDSTFVMTVTDRWTVGNCPFIDFDSLVTVKSIELHYFEDDLPYYTEVPRIWYIDVLNTISPDSLVQFDSTGAAIDQTLSGYVYQNQIITFNNLNKRCNRIAALVAVSTYKICTITVHLTTQLVQQRQLLSVELSAGDPAFGSIQASPFTLNFTENVFLEYVRVQHFGILNRQFTLLDNAGFNLTDVSSVTNIKTVMVGDTVNSFTMSAGSVVFSGSNLKYGDIKFNAVYRKLN